MHLHQNEFKKLQKATETSKNHEVMLYSYTSTFYMYILFAGKHRVTAQDILEVLFAQNSSPRSNAVPTTTQSQPSVTAPPPSQSQQTVTPAPSSGESSQNSTPSANPSPQASEERNNSGGYIRWINVCPG